MSTLRTNTLETLDSSFSINVEDLATSGSVVNLRNDLANSSDVTKGAALVGRATVVIKDVAQLLTVPGRYDGDIAYLVSYRSSQVGVGGGIVRWEASSTTTPDNGQVFQVTGVTVGRWKRVLFGPALVTHWGVYNDGTNPTANNTSLQAARDYVATTKNKLVFPAGIYAYSVSPNWAVQDASIQGEGLVYLRYSGTGQALIVDGGATGVGLFCMDMRGFIVQAPASALNGVYVRAMHHSDFGFRVDGAGSAAAGIRVDFAVCTTFHKPEVSNNSSNGWYLGAKPLVGILCSQRGAGEQVAYCKFENPILEGVNNGAQLDYALGSQFNGGTMEGCTNVGILFGAGALRNKVNYVDFEVNSVADVSFTGGTENEINSCDTEKLIFVGAGDFNKVVGGAHKSISVAAAANGTLLEGFVYNRANDGGTLTDAGNRTRMSNLTLGPSLLNHNAKPTTSTVTVGASPFTYTNTTGNNQVLYIVGGTISSISLTPVGGTPNSVGVGTAILMCPQDAVTITYTAAPTAYTNSR